ncbi:MAG: SDR family oxidoreductase [Alphaproteobacteria bacterium]|nr:SDR family oxidoreductase [Alphaproteobacteria bacterium]
MDLGLKGRKAIVCAGSKGLGKGCAAALAAEGVDLVVNGRGVEALEATAAELRAKYGVKVTAVAADVTTAEGRAKLLAACPDPDILINNAGGPPAGDFREWDEAAWHKAVEGNMITPIMLIKATIDGMIGRKFGRIVNITSGAVKAPIAQLGLSNGARTGLTGFVAGLSRQVAKHNVTINGLLPGPFETDRLRSLFTAASKTSGQPIEQVAEARRKANPAERFGTAEEFGAACAFLCSVHAGYIVGQNILLDGGAFPGTL